MIGRVGRVEVFVPFALCPIELAAIYDHTAHRGAMSADEFGCGMRDNMGTPFEGTAEVWGGEGIVDQQRNTKLLRDLCHFLQRKYVHARIADDLAIDYFCVGLNCSSKIFRLGWIDECHVDSQTRKCIFELANRSAK